MANHLRRQIRDNATTTLTGLTTTSTRVFKSRARLIQAADLPCLRIYCDDEVIENATMGPYRERKRTLTLVVEGCCAGNSGYDDTADLIVKEVEIALDNDNSLAGVAKWVEPKRITHEFAADGETVIAVAKMEFEVLYYAAKGAPDVAL